MKDIKQYLASPKVKERISEILQEKAPQFISTLISVTSSNSAFDKCDPLNIIDCALISASLDLPINQNLGFACIIPYKNTCQFQVMAKGYVQLALRSGNYSNIGNSVVYQDEIISYDPIMGDFSYKVVTGGCRDQGSLEGIVGYVAFFETKQGYRKFLYMSKREMENYAKTYVPSYNSQHSMWNKNFHAMANKTVLKKLLKQSALLSTDLTTALANDQTEQASFESPKMLEDVNIDNGVKA